MKRLFFLFLLSLNSTILFSQWQVIAKREGEDLPLDIIVTDNNDFIVASSNSGQDSSGLVLSRYNTNGLLLWSKIYSSIDGIYGNGILTTLLNNNLDQSFFLFTSIDNVNNFYSISKLNNLGDQIWTKTLNVGGSPFLLSDGSILINGGKCRIDNDGNVIWLKTFTSNECYDIQNDVYFNVFKELTGQTYLAGGRAGEDGMLTRLNFQGDTLWTSGKTLPAGPAGAVNHICQVNSNIFLFTNLTSTIYAIDSLGTPLWAASLNDGSNTICKRIFKGTNTTFFVVGQTNGQGNGNYDIFISKHNQNGSFIQGYTIGGNLSDELIDAEMDSNGDLLLLSKTLSFNSLGFDTYLIKIPGSSLEICTNNLPANFSVPVTLIENPSICYGLQSISNSIAPFSASSIENSEIILDANYICQGGANNISNLNSKNNQVFRLEGNVLEVSTSFYLCDISGRILFKSDGGNVLLKSGVYVVVIDGIAHKIIL